VPAQSRPKRPIAAVLRQVLDDEPSPWAVTLFLWSLATFGAATGMVLVTLLIEALTA
jgi:hypothetical protein